MTRLRYNPTPGGAGYGVNENQLHVATGLRLASASYAIPGCILDLDVADPGLTVLKPIAWGGSAGASVGSWTSLAGASLLGFMPCPATPQLFFSVMLGAGTTWNARFRVSGYDQFGNHIVETTPVLNGTGWTSSKYAHLITLSKVFSFVEDIEYMSTSVSSTAGSKIACGLTNIITPGQVDTTYSTGAVTEDYGGQGGATNKSYLYTMGTYVNFGLGTPLRIHAYSSSDPTTGATPDSNPHKDPELISFAHCILRNYDGTATTQKNLAYVLRSHKASGLATTGVTVKIGVSASGWQGTPHKLAPFTGDDDIATGGDATTNGSSEAAAASVPPAGDRLGDINADTKTYHMVIRSGLGTHMRTGHNPSYNYPKG